MLLLTALCSIGAIAQHSAFNTSKILQALVTPPIQIEIRASL